MTESIHDFTAKLRQPSLLDHVERYVRWRKDLRRARAEGRPAPPPPDHAPISINLDLTTACNYRCDHCIDWDILNTKHRHDEETLRSAIITMVERGLRSTILIGGGEPTIYPGFSDFVRFLKDLELQVAIVTNGSRGDKLLEIADVLETPDWVRLSLDAGGNELFRAMHKPVKKSLSLDEICAWIPRIKQRNPNFQVGYSYIIVWQGASRDDVAIRENIDEVVLATERAKRYGFDYIALKPVLERAQGGAEVMDPSAARDALNGTVVRIREQVSRAQALADERFAVRVSTNLRVLEEGSWRDYTNQPSTCHMQALRQVLTPMGTFNCPAHRGVEKARVGGQEAYADAAMAKITSGQLADLMDRFDASHECREVTCLYNGVNWWLEKMIEDPREEIDIEPGDERSDFFL
ncbi:MAG: radical SAM protein [Myxococcales bacterium]|nr:radical SAM protein [Myxococcales bacterium]MDH5566060.1 radical SAM protein [Myxococcales bacterium]